MSMSSKILGSHRNQFLRSAVKRIEKAAGLRWLELELRARMEPVFSQP